MLLRLPAHKWLPRCCCNFFGVSSVFSSSSTERQGCLFLGSVAVRVPDCEGAAEFPLPFLSHHGQAGTVPNSPSSSHSHPHRGPSDGTLSLQSCSPRPPPHPASSSCYPYCSFLHLSSTLTLAVPHRPLAQKGCQVGVGHWPGLSWELEEQQLLLLPRASLGHGLNLPLPPPIRGVFASECTASPTKGSI